jgi:hypothetical protein
MIMASLKKKNKNGDPPNKQTPPPVSPPSSPQGRCPDQEETRMRGNPKKKQDHREHRHRHHHTKKTTSSVVLPRNTDVIIGATHHPGTRHCVEIVESIFDDSGGISYNPRIYDAIWYELNSAHFRKILFPVDCDNPEDPTLKAREASQKEREDFLQDCYEKVAEKRASVSPPRLQDVWMSNEDHPGTKACMAIVQMAAKHFEGENDCGSSTIIDEYIEAQLGGRRFLDRPLCADLPWHAATLKECKKFIHEAFLKAREELEDKAMDGASLGAPLG